MLRIRGWRVWERKAFKSIHNFPCPTLFSYQKHWNKGKVLNKTWLGALLGAFCPNHLVTLVPTSSFWSKLKSFWNNGLARLDKVETLQTSKLGVFLCFGLLPISTKASFRCFLANNPPNLWNIVYTGHDKFDLKHFLIFQAIHPGPGYELPNNLPKALSSDGELSKLKSDRKTDKKPSWKWLKPLEIG